MRLHQGEARMGDFVERHRRAASVRIDGGKMQAQLAAAVQDRSTDRGVAASIQSVCVSATGGGAQGSGAGESGGATTTGSVDLVALVHQWTVSLRRLVSALLAVRHKHGQHGGSTFHRVQAWTPALEDAVRVLSDRVANARMLVSQLRQLCPELESSIQALEAAIYDAAEASGSVLNTPGRRAGRREREATQHLAMATPAGAYAPRSLSGLNSESRPHRSATRGDRGDDGAGISGGLTTVVRPTLPRGTFSAGRPAAVTSRGVGSGTRSVGVGVGASTAGQGAGTARLSTHVEASPSAETPTPGGDDSPVARQLTFG